MSEKGDKYASACEECLKEMFRRVGEEYPNEKLTSQAEWYNLRMWTEKEYMDFRGWLVAFLRKRFKWAEKKCNWEAGLFLLDWGWKTKESV